MPPIYKLKNGKVWRHELNSWGVDFRSPPPKGPLRQRVMNAARYIWRIWWTRHRRASRCEARLNARMKQILSESKPLPMTYVKCGAPDNQEAE